MSQSYIVDAVRTPRGRGKRGKGALTEIHPQELLAQVLQGLAARGTFDAATVDDVIIGCVSQVRDQGANVARNAVLAAGWPDQVSAVSLNRFCASGLQAVHFAAMAVASGAMDLAIGGGYTENNENVWVSSTGKITASPIGYLRGVPDYDENGIAYDANAPGFAYQSASFTWAQLETMLARDSRTRVGRLLELRFLRGVSGRIIRITVVGSARTAFVSGPAFKAIYNAQRLSGGGLKSSLFYLERVR